MEADFVAKYCDNGVGIRAHTYIIQFFANLGRRKTTK